MKVVESRAQEQEGVLSVLREKEAQQGRDLEQAQTRVRTLELTAHQHQEEHTSGRTTLESLRLTVSSLELELRDVTERQRGAEAAAQAAREEALVALKKQQEADRKAQAENLAAEQLRLRLRSAEDETSFLRAELTTVRHESNQTLNRTTTELAETANKLEVAQVERNNAQDEVAGLKERVRSLEGTCARALKEAQEAREAQQTLEDHMATELRAKDSLLSLFKARLGDSEAQLAQSQTALSAAKEAAENLRAQQEPEKEEMRGRIRSLEAELGALRATPAPSPSTPRGMMAQVKAGQDVDRLMQEKRQLEEMVGAYTSLGTVEELRAQAAQVRRVTRKLEEQQHKERESRPLRLALQEAEQERDRLRAHWAQLVAQQDPTAELSTVRGLVGRVTRLEADLERTHSQQAEDEALQRERIRVDLRALEEQREGDQRLLRQLMLQLEQERAQRVAAPATAPVDPQEQVRVKLLEEEHARVLARTRALEDQLSSLRTELTRAQSAVEVAQEREKSARSELQPALRSAEAHREQAERTLARLHQAEEQRMQAQAQAGQHEAEARRLAMLLRQAQVVHEEQQRLADRLLGETQQARERAAAAEAQAEAQHILQRTQTQAQRETVSRLEAALAEQQGARDKAQEQLRTAEKELSSARKDLDVLKTAHAHEVRPLAPLAPPHLLRLSAMSSAPRPQSSGVLRPRHGTGARARPWGRPRRWWRPSRSGSGPWPARMRRRSCNEPPRTCTGPRRTGCD